MRVGWPTSTFSRCPVSASQIRMPPSQLAVTIMRPSGENLALETCVGCSARTKTVWPVATSQTRAVRSQRGAVCAEREAQDARRMTFERGDEATVLGIPYPDDAVPSRGQEACPVGREGDDFDLAFRVAHGQKS